MARRPLLVVDCGSRRVPAIERLLAACGAAPRTVKLGAVRPEDGRGTAGIVVSGGPILLAEADPAPHLERLGFLRAARLPVLGICFGHQVLGLLHGARVFRMAPDRGPQRIEAVGVSPLFAAIDLPAVFTEDHCEAVTLPRGFVHVARSAACEVEAMQHEEHPLYGVQFHPEASGDVGARLFANFVRQAGAARP